MEEKINPYFALKVVVWNSLTERVSKLDAEKTGIIWGIWNFGTPSKRAVLTFFFVFVRYYRVGASASLSGGMATISLLSRAKFWLVSPSSHLLIALTVFLTLLSLKQDSKAFRDIFVGLRGCFVLESIFSYRIVVLRFSNRQGNFLKPK